MLTNAQVLERMTQQAKVICLFFLVWIQPVHGANESVSSPDISAIELGKQIYREGKLPDGESLYAVGAGNAPIIGTQITCISCHRRSGLGTSEGNNRAPPITGDILFQPRTQNYRELMGKRLTGEGARPAYTEDTFLTAINEGKDVTGRALNPLMPRYALSKTDAKFLIQYLNSLSTHDAPGISATKIYFATIFTPDTLPEQKDAAEKTLRAFFHDYNAQTRNEKHRAKNAPWHKSWQYESFRELELYTWQLEGPATTWKSQLKKLYEQQPVFALLNGISHTSWQPIHDFCETMEVPCLFPTTDFPGQSNEHYYSVYFSEGVNLEARALASYISNQSDVAKNILQVYRRKNTDQAAASLSQQLASNKNIKVVDMVLDDDNKLDAISLKEKIRQYQADTLILWLDQSSIKNIGQELGNNTQLRRIYVSRTFAGNPTGLLPDTALDKIYLMSRFIPEKELNAHLRRFTAWAKPRNIYTSNTDSSEQSLSNLRVAANAYFTALVVSSAIRGMRANLSRDYLIERIEHNLERAVFHSIYPEFTLGPSQRFASKGSYIIGPLHATDPKSTLSQQWIIP